MSLETALLATLSAGTGLEVSETLRQGEQAQELAQARADIDLRNAQAVDEATDEKARILEKRRIRTVATTKSDIAASGIKLGRGIDLVLEAEINATFLREKKFATKSGRTEAQFLKSRAGLELGAGRAAVKSAKSKALVSGLIGFGSIAFLGLESGILKNPLPGAKRIIGGTVGGISKVVSRRSRTAFRRGTTSLNKSIRGTKSFLGGAGRLNQGPKTLFDFNTGGIPRRTIA